MKFELSDYEPPDYEHPVLGIAWTSGVGGPAAIFLLEGECHVAGAASPAARYLERKGALRIATMRFDRDPHEASHSGRPYRPLRREEAVREMAPGASRN